jgi:hypothetical protein
MAYDIIIDDAEFIQAERFLLVYVDKVIECATSCIEIIGLVNSRALHATEINTKLSSFAEAFRVARGLAMDVETTLRGTSDTFVNRIDEIDSFIY